MRRQRCFSLSWVKDIAEVTNQIVAAEHLAARAWRPIAWLTGGMMRPMNVLAVALMLPVAQAQSGGGSLTGDAFRVQAAGTEANTGEGGGAVVEKEEQPVPTRAKEEANEPDWLPESSGIDAAKGVETSSVVEANVTEAPTAEATAAPVPAEATAQPVEQVTTVPVTTTPALRSNDSPTIANAATNAEASGSVREYLNQGNPLLLAGFAAICCFFLLLWGRKRRLASLNGGGAGGSSGHAAVDSGVGAVGATATKKINSKVQYSRIDDQFEAESPFSRNHDDSDDYDDEDEDGFGQDRDKWDDWEPEDSAADPNPFAAPVGSKFAMTPVASSPLPSVAASAPAFKLIPPPAASATAPDARATELHEIVLSSIAKSPPANSVGSNSSSDSFEVVTEESSMASPYPLFPAPTKSLKKPEPEEKKQSVDDLFSQFGMVPTFKNGVQQQPAAVSSSFSTPGPSSSRAAGSGMAAATTTTATPSSSALPSAAEASALFAAELDDLGITAAAEDWGEDDEWVKGI